MDNGHYVRKVEELQEKLDECQDIAGEIVDARGRNDPETGSPTMAEQTRFKIRETGACAATLYHDEAVRISE